MAKFHGLIGFSEQLENPDYPGVWEEQIVEKHYGGDLLHLSRSTKSEGINDDVTINNKISILMDSYLNENLFSIRYVTFMGVRWKVSAVDVSYPRLTLTLGGKFNG